IPDVRFPHPQWGPGMMYGRPYYHWVPYMGDGRGYNFYNPHQHMVYGRPYYWVPPPALEYTKGCNPMEQRKEEERANVGGRGSRYPEEERYNYNNKRSNSVPEGRNYEENAYERGGGNNKWDFRNIYDRLRDEDENDYDQPTTTTTTTTTTSSSNRGRGNERYTQSRDRREERNNYNSDYYTRGNERTYNNSNVTSSANRELMPYKKEILPFGVSNSELEDKLTEEELNERIRRLDFTVSVKDMFILWNHILAHERKKYTKMQEYLMYYSQYLEKTYLVPTAFRKKYWWRVHYILTEEVVKRERTDNLDFHQFLRKGSCEKREFLYFINSKRKAWADLTETMKNIWMERLTYKMRKYSGA
ncbi:exported protein (PHISTc), partial [Plasmodium reichenowi]